MIKIDLRRVVIVGHNGHTERYVSEVDCYYMNIGDERVLMVREDPSKNYELRF